jgi:transposase
VVTNDEAGSAALGAKLQAVAPPRMVLEATGGYQRAVVAALAAAGLPVAVVNPRHARDVATATGPLAKTHRLAARAFAHVADAVRPARRPVPEAQTAERRALLARRRHLIARRTAAQNRLGGASQRRRADIQAQMTGLDPRRATLDDELDPTRRASPVGRAHEALLHRVPGLGPVCPRTWWLDRPAWGTLSRQRLAALVGVAPFHRDSGPLRGTRTVWGGRTHIRAALSMSPLVAVRSNQGRNGCYQRLRAAGKAAKVALTACMRNLFTILKAMIQPQTPWQAQEEPIASHPRAP